MAEKSAKKQTTINLIASLVSFGINLAINFFLTPYLIGVLGTESYGFIGLANDFVQYAGIITSALNMMAGRFISVAYHKGDKEEASRLFSSVMVANFTLAGILLVFSVIFIAVLEYVVHIPQVLVGSVKITFAMTFLTFIVSVITAVFTTAAFVKNRVDINSVRDILANIIKVAVLVLLFLLLPAKLYYLAVATLISGIFLLFANITVRRKILPDVTIRISDFRFPLVKIILASGVWMSLAQLSNVLISGVDLLVCNLTLGAALMGVLSLAKTIPHCLANLIISMAKVFTPHFTILYVKNDHQELAAEVNRSSRIMSFLLTVPIAGFIIFGIQFYTLWQPTKTAEEIRLLQTLSVLNCVMYLFTVHTQCMTMLNSVCNKMKMPVLVSIGTGLVSTAVTVLILRFGDLGDNGIYVIAGMSSALISLKSAFFVPLYAAHILKVKWWTFLPSIFRGWVAFGVLIGIFCLISSFATITGWASFLLVAGSAAVVGYGVTLPILFNKKEICGLASSIRSKLTRGGK